MFGINYRNATTSLLRSLQIWMFQKYLKAFCTLVKQKMYESKQD